MQTEVMKDLGVIGPRKIVDENGTPRAASVFRLVATKKSRTHTHQRLRFSDIARLCLRYGKFS